MINELTQIDPAGRMRGDERREQILRTAVELFSQRGFKGTTTKEIARAAKVSEAMVFRHFASKDELYAAILNDKECKDGVHNFPWEHNEDLRRALEEKDDFAVFYNIAKDALAKHQSNVGLMRLLFYSALEEHQLAEMFFQEFISRIYEFIGGYIEMRQKDGAMKQIDARMAVRAFLGMLIHHSINNILWDKQRRIIDISNEDAAKGFTQILLNGIKA